MGLDPKVPVLESQEDYQKRLKKNLAINFLEPPFPWIVQSFDPFSFNLHVVPDQGPVAGASRRVVVPFTGGGGTFGGGGAGSNF